MTDTEPARPVRGQTADELGPDVSEEQAEAAAKESTTARMLAALKPSFLLSQADNYPVGVKQFLQFCLILIYPGWVFAVLAMGAIYAVFYACMWVLLSPFRIYMRIRRPEEYAANKAKFKNQ